MPDDPFTSPRTPSDASDADSSGGVSNSKVAYNVVSDTVTGLNLRGSDNKFQAKFVSVSVCLLALVGTVLTLLMSDSQLPWYAGAIAGAFAGLIFGVFASGIFLMIYRFIRHAKGKHD